MGIRDKETKEAFIKFLEENPSQRFYQAVVNFTSGQTDLPCWSLRVCTSPKDQGDDVFYVEGDEHLIKEKKMRAEETKEAPCA